MALTVAEAEAAIRALRLWPAGRRAYALAWSPEGAGYHHVSALALALRTGACTMEQLGPAATIALMRLVQSRERCLTNANLTSSVIAAVRDLRAELVLSPREWVDLLGDPPTLAARLERWALDMRAFLHGEVLNSPRSPETTVQIPADPSQRRVVPLSATAREALSLLASDGGSRLSYDLRTQSWFVTRCRASFDYRVRERTAGWLVREDLVDLEPLESGVRREDRGLQYVISTYGRHCLAAKEPGETI